MEKYDEALEDIKNAIKKQYPKELLYKLYERQARCYLAQKKLIEAMEAFKYVNFEKNYELFPICTNIKNLINLLLYFKNRKTVTALDDSKLPHEKKTKIEKDSMIMIKMLENDPQLKAMMQKKKLIIEKKEEKHEKEFISDALTIDYNPEEGRFAKASKNIDVGDDIIIEKPNVFALLEKYSKTHCQHCFNRFAFFINFVFSKYLILNSLQYIELLLL